MNKSKALISNPVFTDSSLSSKPNFNLVATSNTFISIFDPKSLDKQEEEKIQRFLSENLETGNYSKENEQVQLDKDFQQLKLLTSEIKAIQKQNLVLLGERLAQARIILKKYKEGTFTKWLKDI